MAYYRIKWFIIVTCLALLKQQIQVEADTPADVNKTKDNVTAQESLKDTIENVPVDNSEGRHAFINNQFVSDADILTDTLPAPLYDMLHQHMGHVLYGNGKIKPNSYTRPSANTELNKLSEKHPSKVTSDYYSPSVEYNGSEDDTIIKRASVGKDSAKGNLNFHTVSTSTQFVTTPLVDFIIKYSIGMAKKKFFREDSKFNQIND